MGATQLAEHLLYAQRHRLTVRAFHRLAEAGILGEDDRVELIEGALVDMPPIGSEHAGEVRVLIQLLTRAAADVAIVDAQNPLVLGQESEPQPDIMLLKRRADFYRRSHPGPEDVLLLIEVADPSAHYDRTVKIPLYARFGIAEVWLLDLPHRRLGVYRTPRPEHSAYQHLQQHFDGTVSPALLPGVAIDVAQLFAV
jgi:Uma2 family endonuclease